MNDLAKNVILWIVVAVVLWSVVSNFGGGRSPRVTPTEYSVFLDWVRDGSVKEVVFEDKTIRGIRSSGDTFLVYNPETSNTALIGELEKSNVTFSGAPEKQPNFLLQLFISSFPILLLIGEEAARRITGGIVGADMLLYGLILMCVIMIEPRGVVAMIQRAAARTLPPLSSSSASRRPEGAQ